MTVLSDTEWMVDAKCRGVDVDMFFPGAGQGVEVEVAVRFCGDCPVKGECLRYALEQPGMTGVWGATSHKERVKIRAGKRPMPSWGVT